MCLLISRKLSRAVPVSYKKVKFISYFWTNGGYAYVAEWSKALDLRSIVLLYAQVRTLSYANRFIYLPSFSF